MADHTHIEWTEATWNVATGCRSFNGDGVGSTTGVQLYPDRLQLPLRWRKPRRIFVCSLADLFHDQVPDEYIAKVFATMAKAPQHTFQILTKRHGRMRFLLSRGDFPDLIEEVACDLYSTPCGTGSVYEWPLPNVHLGVSAENQQWARTRGDILRAIPAAVRFYSCEPLLGPINDLNLTGISWVITGGESGPGARPAHPDWFRSIRDQCQAAGVAYLHKQNGEYLPWSGINDGGTPDVYVNRQTGAVISWEEGQWQHRRRVMDMNWQAMRRVGKKNAGRLLDGRTWDEYPVTK